MSQWDTAAATSLEAWQELTRWGGRIAEITTNAGVDGPSVVP